MILIAAALACVASVPLTGGRLARLLDLRLRCGWAALTALALQVIITTLAPTGPTGLHVGLHLASYALAAAYIAANRRITGLPILALGAALNCLAIIANSGIMPASAHAMRLAGLPPATHFANSAPVAHPHLLALGDVIPVPGPWPLGNVISIGDILIITGLLTVLHHASRASSTPRTDAAFVACGEDLEDELGGAVGQRELTELVKHDELGASVAPSPSGRNNSLMELQ